MSVCWKIFPVFLPHHSFSCESYSPPRIVDSFSHGKAACSFSSTRSPCTILNPNGSSASNPIYRTKMPPPIVKTIGTDGELDRREEIRGGNSRVVGFVRGARSCGRHRGCRTSRPRCRRQRSRAPLLPRWRYGRRADGEGVSPLPA